MLNFIFNQASKIKARLENYQRVRRWERLRSRGMRIGKGVNLPISTWIDTAHCFLISIGDNCGFGDECVILAHDAMPNEYIDASKIGLVTIHESCHFGARTVILPGVEIGPRSIVGSNSVVINSIPPETVAAGNPAKVICTLEEYLDKHRELMKTVPLFPYKEYDNKYLNSRKRWEMTERLKDNIGYMTGGYTAMIENGECLFRTK